MHTHMIAIEHDYPENIQLIDKMFDHFGWQNLPRELMSCTEIENFLSQTEHQTGQVSEY